MNNFYSVLNRPPRTFAPSGNRFKTTYQLQIEPDGRKILVETGTIDIYEQIQSFKNECLIENIVKRALAGDVSALAKSQGVYIDTTLIPKDLISAHEAVKQAESLYKHLPADIRSKFSSFKNFIDNFGTLENINAFYESLTNNAAGSKASDTADSTNSNDGGEANA